MMWFAGSLLAVRILLWLVIVFCAIMAGVAVNNGEFGKGLTLSLITLVDVGLLILIEISETRR